MHNLEQFHRHYRTPKGEALEIHCVSDSNLTVSEQDRKSITLVPAYQNISSSVTREYFLRGRVLLRESLKHSLGADLHFLDRKKHSRTPAWPSGVQGSLSHTAGYTAALTHLITDRFFGIDVEHKLKPESYAALRERVLRSQPKWPDLTPQGILDAYVLYECVYKAISEAGLPEPQPKDLSVASVFQAADIRVYKTSYMESCDALVTVLEGSKIVLSIAEVTLSPCNFYTNFLR